MTACDTRERLRQSKAFSRTTNWQPGAFIMTWLLALLAWIHNFPLVAAIHFQQDASAATRLQEGKAQLERVRSEPLARDCWTGAVDDLQEGCKNMDDTQHSKLAVKFTNCKLQQTGLETYDCTPDMSVEACTRPMVDSTNSIAYNTYIHFFTHAESMCFYLQSSAFQAATEQAVDALQSTAAGTAARLGELQEHAGALIDDTKAIRAEQAAASEAASALLAGQRLASAELQSLSSAQAAAFEAAESSLAQLGGESQAALDELRRGTEEIGKKQGTLLGGLDRVLSLQGSVLGEFLDIKTLFFYTCAVMLCLALTATPRTAGARLPIFALLTLNLILEKLLATFIFSASAQPESLHGWIAMCRRLVMVSSVSLLAYAVLHHTDVGKRTLSALDELKAMHQKQSDEMQERLDRLEKEAQALRSRESSLMAMQAVALRKQVSASGNGRRHTSPVLVGLSGGRRAISPLAMSAASQNSRRSSRSPVAAEKTSEGTTGLTETAEGSSSHLLSLEKPRPPTPPEDDEVQIPTTMDEEPVAEKPKRLSAASLSALAANVASGVAAAGRAVGDAVGATPAANPRKASRRRSSNAPNSNETDVSSVCTPTRRSARIASRQSARA